ncbi:MAG: M50 family metallopeptidase [Candidatus Saccharimonadales bacterium]
MLITGILLGLFVLVFLVVVHELGHAIVARRNNVVVEEFGIGFPPKAWSKKLKTGVLFTLNWLPLGGFVKLKGEYDSAEGKGTYGGASYWQKTRILLAGVLVNWVVAAVLLTFLALFGLPKVLPGQFSINQDTEVVQKPLLVMQVEEESPAVKGGLETGDEILRFNGMPVRTSQELSDYAKEYKGQEIELIYVHEGQEYTSRTILRADNKDNKGYLGVATGEREELKATWSAPLVGIGTTVQFTWATLEGVGTILFDTIKGVVLSLSFSDEVRKDGNETLSVVGGSVAGPVGILGVIFPQAEQAGLKQIVFLSAIISLSLAVMNVLPIPALDGGRWFTMTIYKLRKKKLTKEREEKIQTVGFLVLMGLVVLVTLADVGKF